MLGKAGSILSTLNPLTYIYGTERRGITGKADLTATQLAALDELQRLFAAEGTECTAGELIGYLKVRSFKISEAAAQFRTTLSWAPSMQPTISDVAPFLRGPGPDGCVVCLEKRLTGDCARDLKGRPIIACIGMPYGTLRERQNQLCYALRRARTYHRDADAVISNTFVVEILPRDGANATFRFPDANDKLLIEFQRTHFPGTLNSTTHFCGIPSVVAWSFALCKPFMDAEAYNNMVLRPDFSHLKNYIAEENLPVEWGGKFTFSFREYAQWRAEEEGVTIGESDVRRYDPKTASSTAQAESMLEAMLQMSAVEHTKLAVKKGVLRKQGSGQGLFATYKWKQKLLILLPVAVGVPSVLLYFDSTEESDKNMPSKVIRLASGGCYVEPSGKGTDGADEKFAISLVTPERNYTFAALNQKERDEWMVAIRSAINTPALTR
jgi:hypothetical protein